MNTKDADGSDHNDSTATDDHEVWVHLVQLGIDELGHLFIAILSLQGPDANAQDGTATNLNLEKENVDWIMVKVSNEVKGQNGGK